MNNIKVFISSRVNSTFSKLDAPFILTELREYLRTSLEIEKFLSEPILEVIVNESNFNSTISKNAFDNCMDTLRQCNVIIILYNGQGGWYISDSGSSNGICHEEFLLATAEFSDMSFMLDLSAFFEPNTDKEEKEKDEAFAQDIKRFFSHTGNIANDYKKGGNEVIEVINESNWGSWRHNITNYLSEPKLRAALSDLLNL